MVEDIAGIIHISVLMIQGLQHGENSTIQLIIHAN